MKHAHITITNIGTKAANDIYINIRSKRKNLFYVPTIVYEPRIIEDFIYKNDTIENSERIYYRLRELPCNGGHIKLFIGGKQHFNEGDIIIEIISDGKVQKIYRKEIEFGSISFPSFKKYKPPLIQLGSLYAQSKNDSLETSNQKQSTGGGVFFGGYDPVVLTNGIFQLLQKNGIISKTEAIQIINKVTDESSSGMKIGGVDVLKFDEEVLNLLLKKRIINNLQANQIVQRSKDAGGILINGYNVIQLKYEILNFLLTNKYVNKSDAQAVLDNARSN
ncbi:hypothetical protein H8E88_21615 [candidate division KSB1 bacterium]|nr:hypothetical protein [candidate division KSB1 bacterium]